MTCPGVLVCVGREAFSPLLVNFIRKSSEEKLPGLGNRSPGLGPRTPGNGARSPATQGEEEKRRRSPPHGAQSRASEYSEGHESKKNGELWGINKMFIGTGIYIYNIGWVKKHNTQTNSKMSKKKSKSCI